MSATIIMRELLVAHAPVVALVPRDRIRIGELTQGTTPPAILITDIGGNEIPTMARNRGTTTVKARVQVTVYAWSYDEQEKMILACKLGAGVHTGVYRGHYANAVVPLGTNPSIVPGDDRIFERSRDFMVTFTEAN